MRFLIIVAGSIVASTAGGAADLVMNVPKVAANPNDVAFYVPNRAPLAPSPLVKLPLGSIKPYGWLKTQVDLEADGMTGHLEEISKWCKFEGNAWATPDGLGHSGWEELPYWLKGYGDLGYVLADEKIIKEAKKWIDGMLSSQEADGWFGPRSLKTSLDGHPDLWPHMLMLNVLQSYHEYSRDSRVIPFMTRYMKWLNDQPPSTFSNGYWPRIRWGDAIETAYWLYNRTGDAFLLDLAAKIHANMENWTSGVHNWHNVNVSQGFREPGVYFQQGLDRKFLKAADDNYKTVRQLYGQFPGGGFAGDENCRPGHTDPHQGFETCGMVELMHSFEMLTKISGDAIWSDRCEDVAFNSLPASLTPDWKGLHYLTAANQVQLDAKNHAPGVDNSGVMFSYSPYEVYRCCQHNVSHGWPYFAEELWLATADHGLCASLYAPSEVTARVAQGNNVKIVEETDYPFSGTISLKIYSSLANTFPIYFRVPQWCDDVGVDVNGDMHPTKSSPGSYVKVVRNWKDGDSMKISFRMVPRVKTWEHNHRAVSVEYGPLTFSLKIGEDWKKYGGTDAWPEYEVYPSTPWNYGLDFGGRKASDAIRVIRKPGPMTGNPFTQAHTPIELAVTARKIPAWTMDRDGLVGSLQDSPIASTEPVESVTLIPMGAARLRISSFPMIGSGANARQWDAIKPSPLSASHCFSGDSVDAVMDGVEPSKSNDQTIPRFTWWDHKGSTEWVQFNLPAKKSLHGAKVYWFDDAPNGGCRAPKAWRVLTRQGDAWRPVSGASGYGTTLNEYNSVTFDSVETTAVRLEVELQPDYSGGILEWKLE